LDVAALIVPSHAANLASAGGGSVALQQTLAFEQKRQITLLFGATVLGVTYLLDRRTKHDYAFWLYLFGLVAYWGALSSEGVGSFAYAVINLGLILVAVLLQRKTFVVFGAIGMYAYLGHLAFEVFRDSLLFPAALTALGIVIIGLGVWYRKQEGPIDAALLRLVPSALRRTLPRFRPQEALTERP